MLRCGGGQQGHGISTDGKECHISQVEQARQTHHNIQTETEQNIDTDRTDGVVPVLAGFNGNRKTGISAP